MLLLRLSLLCDINDYKITQTNNNNSERCEYTIWLLTQIWSDPYAIRKALACVREDLLTCTQAWLLNLSLSNVTMRTDKRLAQMW